MQKTNSFAQAVRLAVAKAERFNDDWYMDRWYSCLAFPYRSSLHREI